MTSSLRPPRSAGEKIDGRVYIGETTGFADTLNTPVAEKADSCR
jgi:hypothetical protein